LRERKKIKNKKIKKGKKKEGSKTDGVWLISCTQRPNIQHEHPSLGGAGLSRSTIPSFPGGEDTGGEADVEAAAGFFPAAPEPFTPNACVPMRSNTSFTLNPVLALPDKGGEVSKTK